MIWFFRAFLYVHIIFIWRCIFVSEILDIIYIYITYHVAVVVESGVVPAMYDPAFYSSQCTEGVLMRGRRKASCLDVLFTIW